MPYPPTSIRDEIRRANHSFEDHVAHGDAAAIARLYTQRARHLASGQEPREGTASIEAFWREVLHQGVAAVRLKTTEVEEMDGTAIELGHYILLGAQGEALDQGKYLVVWKEQQGQWRLHHDIWNSSLPPATA